MNIPLLINFQYIHNHKKIKETLAEYMWADNQVNTRSNNIIRNTSAFPQFEHEGLSQTFRMDRKSKEAEYMWADNQINKIPNYTRVAKT